MNQLFDTGNIDNPIVCSSRSIAWGCVNAVKVKYEDSETLTLFLIILHLCDVDIVKLNETITERVLKKAYNDGRI